MDNHVQVHNHAYLMRTLLTRLPVVANSSLSCFGSLDLQARSKI